MSELSEMEEITVPETIALLVFVTVDVLSPGSASVVCDGGAWAGTAVRDGSSYRVATDEGDEIGKAKSYRDAALRLAGHYGRPPAEVLVLSL